MAGSLIVFEGPEGAGKSTQVQLLADRFTRAGINFRLTREPGGTPAGDAIRSVLLDPQLQIAPLTEFLLYSANRAEHVSQVIQPALDADQVVLCDRFTASSVAYQGHGRKLELPFVQELNDRASGGLVPDLTLLLDLDVTAGLERIAARGQRDRLEQADLAFHERVRQGYLQQARGNSSWLNLDATRPETELTELIWQRVTDLLAERLPHAAGREP